MSISGATTAARALKSQEAYPPAGWLGSGCANHLSLPTELARNLPPAGSSRRLVPQNPSSSLHPFRRDGVQRNRSRLLLDVDSTTTFVLGQGPSRLGQIVEQVDQNSKFSSDNLIPVARSSRKDAKTRRSQGWNVGGKYCHCAGLAGRSAPGAISWSMCGTSSGATGGGLRLSFV
jgi:hypothetical protein